MTTILITGSAGLIGAEATKTYLKKGWTVVGIDNNSRAKYFGPDGSVIKTISTLEKNTNYLHHHIDIKNFDTVKEVFSHEKPDAVIHCAAQPSHDRAAAIPFDDFDTNARGTLNLLEATRQTSKSIPFVHVSTNKVYGDRPNFLKMEELTTRYVCTDDRYSMGIDESMSVDHCTHSLFGVSKLSGDMMAQEYGRYFGMKTGIFRGGCLTGSGHASVALHGFLSYIVKCALTSTPYTIIGYKGKQVRDQIHSKDVVSAFDAFIEDPDCGEVYNIGGEYENSASVIEVISMLEKYNLVLNTKYTDAARIGDHIWYVSDMTKFHTRYKSWKKTISLSDILDQMTNKTRVSQ